MGLSNQRMLLSLAWVLVCAWAMLESVQALAQEPTQPQQDQIAPIGDFFTIRRTVLQSAADSEFQVEIHLEPGAALQGDTRVSNRSYQLVTNQVIAHESNRRIVLIVGKWLDLPNALLRVNASRPSRSDLSDLFVVMVTDAEMHLSKGKLRWPERLPRALLKKQEIVVYAPVDSGGPERVASSGITLFFAAARSALCEHKVAHLWPATRENALQGNNPVGFSAAGELLMRSGRAGSASLDRGSFVVHLPYSFEDRGGIYSFSRFLDVKSWLGLSTSEHVVMGLGLDLLPMPNLREVGFEVSVYLPKGKRVMTWWDFQSEFYRDSRVPPLFGESVLRKSSDGSTDVRFIAELLLLRQQFLADYASELSKAAQAQGRGGFHSDGFFMDNSEFVARFQRMKAFADFFRFLVRELKARTIPIIPVGTNADLDSKSGQISLADRLGPTLVSISLRDYLQKLRAASEAAKHVVDLEVKVKKASSPAKRRKRR